MRPMTRRSFGALSLPVLGAAFSCSFGDDEEEDDKKPNDKPDERRRSGDAHGAAGRFATRLRSGAGPPPLAG